ncbi:MAG: sigma-B regulation protein RsbU (phosphoserine phosphatase) [Bacteriovoracaceae bacterium]|jgi:sigma-B regulation protein RsbU (phosphoserine phosphatase)
MYWSYELPRQMAEHSIRAVSFPIKGKLISVITFLILSSLSVYAYYALDHFKKDKSAYIFETSLSVTEGVSSLLSQDLLNTKQTMGLLGEAVSINHRNSELIRNIFNANPNIIEFSIYDGANRELLFGLRDKNYLKANGLGDDYFLNLTKEKELPFEKIQEKKSLLFNPGLNLEIPHLVVAEFNQNKNQFYVARLKLSNFIDLFNSNSTYETFVLSQSGEVLIHRAMAGNKGKLEVSPSAYYKSFYNESLKKGVKEFDNSKGQRLLVSFEKNDVFDLVVLSEINKEKAFSAADYIIGKSIYFALFLISFAVITGILFSRNLTSHVEKLHQGIKKITGGDFKTKVVVNSRDEIGALSDSFNFMSSEILRYMDEMVEKIRLEKEVEVAQLVQSSFFPPNDLRIGGYDIAAFYSPASECGGDWWGYLEHEGKFSIFIADATGHGVPAALLTATANSSLNFIKEILKENPSLIERPSEMMGMINRVVCSTGNQILMTFFIISFDPINKTINYSNASHNPPLKVHLNKDLIDKSDFVPLLSEPGPHLGKDATAVYKEIKEDLKGDEEFIFFTDGILECVNNNNKPYGQRRFLKALAEGSHLSVFESRDNCVKKAYQFYEDVKPEDDITFLLLKMSSSSKSQYDFSQFKASVLSRNPKLPEGLVKVGNEEADVIFVDMDQIDQAQGIIQKYKEKIIVISSWSDDVNITKILFKHTLSHLIGSNSDQFEREVFDTCSGIKDKEIKNLSYFLDASGRAEEITLTNSLTAIDEIKEVLDKISLDNFFDSPMDYLESISSELASNAIFNATGHESTERTLKVKLSADEGILYKVGKVNNNIVIEVTDNSGSLTLERLFESLNRSAIEKVPEEKKGGAGLGFYMIYSFSNQVIFNLKKDKSTSIICVIEETKRYKKYRSRITSFHYFNDLA